MNYFLIHTVLLTALMPRPFFFFKPTTCNRVGKTGMILCSTFHVKAGYPAPRPERRKHGN